MTPVLFLVQRLSAAVLATAVAVHLGTILYAIRGGLTAGEILARTHGNLGFFAFHAPIGLRNVIREWTPWRGGSLDMALAIFAVMLLVLGFRAVFAVYAA
jgi:fumarate reductase subunit C